MPSHISSFLSTHLSEYLEEYPLYSGREIDDLVVLDLKFFSELIFEVKIKNCLYECILNYCSSSFPFSHSAQNLIQQEKKAIISLIDVICDEI